MATTTQVQSAEITPKTAWQHICDFANNDYKTVVKWFQSLTDWANFGFGIDHPVREYIDLTQASKSLKTVCCALAIPSFFKDSQNFLNDAQAGRVRQATVCFSKMGSDICDIAKFSDSIKATSLINAKTAGYGKNIFQIYAGVNGAYDSAKKWLNPETSATSDRMRELGWKKIRATEADFAFNSLTALLNTLNLAPIIGYVVSSVLITSLGTMILVARTAAFLFENSAKDMERIDRFQGRASSFNNA